MLLVELIFLVRVTTDQPPSLQARIYPEKATYFLGEPIFLDLEMVNVTDKPLEVDSRFGEPCIPPDTIEVVGAKQRSFAWAPSCYRGIAGSCGSGWIHLGPGQKHVERILLNRIFTIENPGTYQVRARRDFSVTVYSNGFSSVKSVTAASDFQIDVVEGRETDLHAVFEPFVRDLSNPKPAIQGNAATVISVLAPRFLEDVILKLADNPNWVAGTLSALASLSTPRTRNRLAWLAEHTARGGTRQPAIGALAQTRHPAVLPVLKRIAKDGESGDRYFALVNIGLLGKRAVPFLKAALREKDVNVQVAAVRGLGASACSSAVPVLIDLLRSPDPQVAKEAQVNLAQLTHYSINKNPFAEIPGNESWIRWRKWWRSNGATADVFDTNSCSEPRPLP